MADTPLESLIAAWLCADSGNPFTAAILTALKSSREKDAELASLRSKVSQLTAALGHSEQERLVARQREAGL